MSTAQMEKHLFNLKFAAKQLNRDSKKCEKEEKAERAKLKKAMEKGNMEVARIHAENGKIFGIKKLFRVYILTNLSFFSYQAKESSTQFPQDECQN